VLRFPADYGHNGFAFNSHLDTDGSNLEENVHTTVTIDERQINTAFRDTRDPYHLTQGGQLGRIHKNFTTIQIAGRIQSPDATQDAGLADRERELLAAFDPALCLRDSPTTQGAYPFSFSERTTDTVNYPTGILPLQYWARPADRPRISESIGDGGWRRYALSLIAPDPRAYEQDEQFLLLTPGSPSGDVVNNGTVPGPLKATIITTGYGDIDFSITRGGVSFVLTLDAVPAGTITVVFETSAPYGIGRSVTRSGSSLFNVKWSDPSTWLDAPVGTTLFTIANTTNVSSCELNWYAARA
jgi:hypothetical protein